MCEVFTCTPSNSRSSGASRSVMTLHRRPRRTAATRNRTGARSRDTLVPDRSLPVSVPSATTPLAVARKLVIFAVIDTFDDVALMDGGLALATAAGARTAKTKAENPATTSLRTSPSLVDETRPASGAPVRTRGSVFQPAGAHRHGRAGFLVDVEVRINRPGRARGASRAPASVHHRPCGKGRDRAAVVASRGVDSTCVGARAKGGAPLTRRRPR